ncbi:MAG TPA: hypothetical protein VJV03_10895 [Pyrinomonadaceae bacterium]|nr:hypothetical protein [Pyrinomonadaceae bacterium]
MQRIEWRLESVQEALGRIELRHLSARDSNNLTDHQFRVFSQWGEDGMIQFLLRHVAPENKVFVEFGADAYNYESNTRFLLTNDNWRGLIIDSSERAIAELKRSRAWELHDLTAVQAFITRENINELLTQHGINGEIGLLSIDIDGNDYWVWQAINVIQPVIVIAEYNHRFGPDRAVTIPYDEKFDRKEAHPSKLYFGASLQALCQLGKAKGYAFVGCNGVNAFFVRADKRPQVLKELTPAEGFVQGKFGEPFPRNGQTVKLSPEEESAFLQSLDLPLVDVSNQEFKKPN